MWGGGRGDTGGILGKCHQTLPVRDFRETPQGTRRNWTIRATIKLKGKVMDLEIRSTGMACRGISVRRSIFIHSEVVSLSSHSVIQSRSDLLGWKRLCLEFRLS